MRSSGDLGKDYVTSPLGYQDVKIGQMHQRRECWSADEERVPQFCLLLSTVILLLTTRVYKRVFIVKIQSEGSLRVYRSRGSEERWSSHILGATLSLWQYLGVCTKTCPAFPFCALGFPFGSSHYTRCSITSLPMWLWEKVVRSAHWWPGAQCSELER